MPRQNSQKILVTGATGFVGSRLVRHFVSMGWEVHVIVRPESSRHELVSVEDRITFHVYDGSLDSLRDAVKKSNPLVVAHLASMIAGEHDASMVDALIAVNITFCVQLVEAMLDHGVNKLVNTGTYWQHYENRPYSPVCLYAATKQACQDMLQYYCEARDLQLVTLKLFDVYGPQDPRKKIFTLFSACSQSSNPLMMSKGEQKLDLVFVEDVANAYLVVANNMIKGVDYCNSIYAVASGQVYMLREVAEMYEKIKNVKLNIQWGGRDYKAREMMEPWKDYCLLPGWAAKVSLQQGIALL